MEQTHIRSTEEQKRGPVECLGQTFESDEARREHYTRLLREGLENLHAQLGDVPFTTVDDAVQRMQSVQHWPMGSKERLHELARRMQKAHREEREKDLLQLWKDQVGFPHGSIEDILSLSDPPYYTACPNPFIDDFIKYYGKPYDPDTDDYKREPYAADVSEGRSDPIYNAHWYHTKVPYKAIMRFVLHYTDPGDVVFDGFAGTGMTGVAAQMCGDRRIVESLGYRVDDDGIIYEEQVDSNGTQSWVAFSKLGRRRGLLNDLSPIASFIAHNYNAPVDIEAFRDEASRLLDAVEKESGWMYATLVNGEGGEAQDWARRLRQCDSTSEIRDLINSKTSKFGQINYVIWSDVFVCPTCSNEVVFWDAAVDHDRGGVATTFKCSTCDAELTKRDVERSWNTWYDSAIGKTLKQAKQIPVLINYTANGVRLEKSPDEFDQELMRKLANIPIHHLVPNNEIPEGDKTGEPIRMGFTHVHHLYSRRNLHVLASLWEKCTAESRVGNALRLLVSSYNGSHSTLMSRIIFKSGGTRPILTGHQSGTLYISSLPVEKNIIHGIRTTKLNVFVKALGVLDDYSFVGTNAASLNGVPDESIDYIFTDPPFGGNLMYSELSFLSESWLKTFTNKVPEAIQNKTQQKDLHAYFKLMIDSFRAFYRALKPGRWMTVEFHNSRRSVWNAIQEALQAVGFVIADVRTLDKQQGSFNQVTRPGSVKQDIIISCYKPSAELEHETRLRAGSEDTVWMFVRAHLANLPRFETVQGKVNVISERQAFLLFDRMVAYHVRQGIGVPISASEFYAGLEQRFPKRDEMYFLPEQVAEYDRKRMTVKEVLQLQLFVNDEASAIQWLKQQLTRKPQTFQELHPQFMREISAWQRHEKQLELLDILGENFLRYDGKGPIPKQVVSWMRQSSELRNIIDTALEDDRAAETTLGLNIEEPQVLARAKDRWYVPDPNQATDIERLRERSLLREFQEYQESNQRRLRVFRLEAVRAGFKKAWEEQDYATILSVADKIPPTVLQEDPQLLMWYDLAVTRTSDDI